MRRSKRKATSSCSSSRDDNAAVETARDGKSALDPYRIALICLVCTAISLLFFTPMQTICDDHSLFLQAPLIEDICFQYDSKALGSKGEFYLSKGHRAEADKVFATMAERGMIPSPIQRPRWGLPRLQSRGFWEIDGLSPGQQTAVRYLEKHSRLIWKEARGPLSNGLSADGRMDANDNHDRLVLQGTGTWSIMRLYFRGRKNSTTCAFFPKTCGIVDDIAANMAPLSLVGQVKFSVLPPGAHIKPHTGPSNLRLRLHLALKIPGEQFRIRVANETKRWQQGRVTILDDSFEHEVLTPSLSPSKQALTPDIDKHRTILIVDILHPDMKQEETRQAFPGRRALRWK
jgi:aspartate beta-hydroxylase